MTRKRTATSPRKKPLIAERQDSDVFSVTAVTVHLSRRDIVSMMAEAISADIAASEQDHRMVCFDVAARWWPTRSALKDWLREQIRIDPGTVESAGWIYDGGARGLIRGASLHLKQLFPEWVEPKSEDEDE